MRHCHPRMDEDRPPVLLPSTCASPFRNFWIRPCIVSRTTQKLFLTNARKELQDYTCDRIIDFPSGDLTVKVINKNSTDSLKFAIVGRRWTTLSSRGGVVWGRYCGLGERLSLSCVATQYKIIDSPVEDACLAEGQVYCRWYVNSNARVGCS